MSKRQKYTPEYRADAVQMVLTSGRSIVEVAASLGINEGTLGNWVRVYKAEHPEADAEDRGPVEWARYERLQAEMAEVKRENEFLKAVSAYFAAGKRK